MSALIKKQAGTSWNNNILNILTTQSRVFKLKISLTYTYNGDLRVRIWIKTHIL